MARKRKRRQLPKSYSAKKNLIRQFEKWPNKPLSPQEKRRITIRAKRWLDSANLFAAIPATKKQKATAEAQGFKTTNKGIIAPLMRENKKRQHAPAKITQSGIITETRRKKGKRIARSDTYIPLSAKDKQYMARWGVERLMQRWAKDPTKAKYAKHILKQDRGWYLGLVYKGGGIGLKSYSADVLQEKIESGKRRLTKKIEYIAIQHFGNGH
jgi:hypothetical protein